MLIGDAPTTRTMIAMTIQGQRRRFLATGAGAALGPLDGADQFGGGAQFGCGGVQFGSVGVGVGVVMVASLR